MDIRQFPKIQLKEDLPPLADCLLENLDEPCITGNIRDEAVEEGTVDEVVEGTDLILYTATKSKRPFAGRVVEVLPNDEVLLQWYVRKGKRRVFEALFNCDGSPSVQNVHVDREGFH